MSSDTEYSYASIWESLRDDPRNDVPAGTRTLQFGSRPDPDYEVMTEDNVKRITHEKVCDVDFPGEMTEEEIADYVVEEVLPLDD